MTAIQSLVALAEEEGVQRFIVGAYILHAGKLLLLRRSADEDFLPGIVELPSGGVDEGETLEEALTREVFEETGLHIVSIDRYVNFFNYVSGSGKKARQLNFMVTVSDPEKITLNPVEHDAYYWVEPVDEAMHGYDMTAETRHVILNAIAMSWGLPDGAGTGV